MENRCSRTVRPDSRCELGEGHIGPCIFKEAYTPPRLERVVCSRCRAGVKTLRGGDVAFVVTRVGQSQIDVFCGVDCLAQWAAVQRG